jgi:hypothetical protein
MPSALTVTVHLAVLRDGAGAGGDVEGADGTGGGVLDAAAGCGAGSLRVAGDAAGVVTLGRRRISRTGCGVAEGAASIVVCLAGDGWVTDGDTADG